jgi:hypothetical protein
MLLREELQDKHIPRRHKLREAIIEEWIKKFGDLKKELAVKFF